MKKRLLIAAMTAVLTSTALAQNSVDFRKYTPGSPSPSPLPHNRQSDVQKALEYLKSQPTPTPTPQPLTPSKEAEAMLNRVEQFNRNTLAPVQKFDQGIQRAIQKQADRWDNYFRSR